MSSQPTVQHADGRQVRIGSTQLWVESEGAGEPLVLLVGGPANSHVSFHPHFSQLADTLRVIYYDYRGRGRSSPTQDPRTIRFRGDVADLESLRARWGSSE